MKPFTADQIEYIIQWMNSWEQLRGTVIPIRFKEAFSQKKCDTGCIYSRSTDQPYPRLCINCGVPEEVALDTESMEILNTPTTSSTQMVNLFKWLQGRDMALQKLKDYPRMQTTPTVEYIKEVNERIKQILHL